MVFWSFFFLLSVGSLSWILWGCRAALSRSRELYRDLAQAHDTVPMVVRRRTLWSRNPDSFVGALRFREDTVEVVRLTGPNEHVSAHEVVRDVLLSRLWHTVRIGPSRRAVGWVVGADKSLLERIFNEGGLTTWPAVRSNARANGE